MGFGLAQGNLSDFIPRGTQIRVRTDQAIDARDRSDGRIYTGAVAEDVKGDDGRMVIPRGARAELIVQNLGDNDLTVDLESITVDGHRYMVATQAYDNARHTGLGANERTGKYVGGGAVFGAIIGALAGGGKGAAIGAAVGGAAGAGGRC
jgi:enhancing lycopene biosynthesis protein 2